MAPTTNPLSALVVDDEAQVRAVVARLLAHFGHEVRQASDGAEAIRLLEERPPDVVITDIMMPGMDGIELLAEIRSRKPEVEVIVMTAFSDIDTAVRAMKAGAYDFLSKPLGEQQLRNTIDTVGMKKSGPPPVKAGDDHLGLEIGDGSVLVGRSEEMRLVFSTIESLRTNKATALIWGETGTGKEYVARAIHYGGLRADKPFFPVNCSAIHRETLESQLFGHVRGAFTGAVSDYEGYFRAASDGTIFLDEITEIDISVQAKLLRALQERTIIPVGSATPVTVAARVMAATNRDPEEAVAEGLLREDLYYRLGVVKFQVPALRHRKSDIPFLSEHFLAKHADNYGTRAKHLGRQAMVRLMEHHWPGNVRELENLVERLYALETPEEVSAAHIDSCLDARAARPSPLGGRVLTLKQAQDEAIKAALVAAGGNKTRAAEMLGIPRQSLYRHIKRLLPEA